jgi:hypothetical protein
VLRMIAGRLGRAFDCERSCSDHVKKIKQDDDRDRYTEKPQ